MSASPHRTRPSSMVRISLCCQYGQRDFLDVLGPASNDEVGKSLHFWIIDEGLLESFFAVWHYAGMVDGDIQWQVRAWLRTELRECVWYDHFLTWEVTDCEVVPL